MATTAAAVVFVLRKKEEQSILQLHLLVSNPCYPPLIPDVPFWLQFVLFGE